MFSKAADTAASTVLIREIRCLPAVALRRRRVIHGLQKFPNFPRNESSNPAKYLTERPEMTTQ
jgi:hypothetical protein